MSSRAKKMAEQVEIKKRTVTVRFSLNLHWYNPSGDLLKDTFVNVGGVDEFTKDDDPLIKLTAEQQLINVINSRLYLELYEPGKSMKDSEPSFFNLTKVDVIEIKDVNIA